MILLCGRNNCMRQWLFVVVAFVLISISLVDASLRLVSVIFRHGDRTPANNGYEMYPKDPYLNHDFYPVGQGQLTNKGKQRAYELGVFLRKRYDDFLGKLYVPHIVTGLSSDYDRTKMSLQLVLAGLFPPEGQERWKKALDWQPIPTDYLRRNEDHLFLADMCPGFVKEYEKIINSPETVKRLEYYNSLMKELPKWTGKEFKHPLDFSYLYHTLHAESSLGLKLPAWTQEIFPNGPLFNATVFGYKVASYTPLLRKLYGGPYIRIFTDVIKDYKTGTLKNPSKVYLYSGHETNVAAVLNALGVFFPVVPDYSSAVIAELHDINHRYFVKIIYYSGNPSTVKELQIPGCDILCPMDTFLKLLVHVIPSDKDLVCKH